MTTPSLKQDECANVTSINDKNDWKTVRNALSVIDFDESDIQVSCCHTVCGNNFCDDIHSSELYILLKYTVLY